MLFGRTQFSTESQFVKEIPQNLIESNLSMREKASEIEAVQTAQARKTFDRTTVKPKANEGGEQFAAGDCVRHKIFGKGIVLSATKMGPDVLYEVAFDTVGTKKLMGSYVKMTKE